MNGKINAVFVNGAKYKCGCVTGSDRFIPIQYIPKKCVTHGAEIEHYYRKKDESVFEIQDWQKK